MRRTIFESLEKRIFFNSVLIILTVILIVLIIGVILYIVYLFTLSGDYASFQEAVMGLFSDPQTFINNLMNFI